LKKGGKASMFLEKEELSENFKYVFLIYSRCIGTVFSLKKKTHGRREGNQKNYSVPIPEGGRDGFWVGRKKYRLIFFHFYRAWPACLSSKAVSLKAGAKGGKNAPALKGRKEGKRELRIGLTAEWGCHGGCEAPKAARVARTGSGLKKNGEGRHKGGLAEILRELGKKGDKEFLVS